MGVEKKKQLREWKPKVDVLITEFPIYLPQISSSYKFYTTKKIVPLCF
jgi:hypothetical protein